MKMQAGSRQLQAGSRQLQAGSGSACCLLAAACLLLLATALRLFRLDAQDIWGDEAFSIWLSQQPLSAVVAGAADTHPPFYPLLLLCWLKIAGLHAFATRALSAFIGVLAVPLIFVFAKRLVPTRSRVAWLAAILAAVSPLLIYYSQETRMYELVAALAPASAYFCLTLFPTPGKVHLGRGESIRGLCGAGYFISTLLAIYTHYSAFFVVAAENLFFVLRWWKNRHIFGALLLRDWVVSQACLIAAYVPWIIVQSSFLRGKASARFDEWGWRGIEMIFGKTFLAFSVGLTMDYPFAQIATAVFLIFAALGVVAVLRERKSSLWLAPLYFAVPVVIAWLVNPVMPFFFERYVLVALPGFYVTVALGLDWFARAAFVGRTARPPLRASSPRNNSRAQVSSIAHTARRCGLLTITIGAMFIGVLVLVSVLSLRNYYFDDTYAKGKYGQMMAYVATHAQPGDALILNNPLQKPLYQYYAPRDIPAFFLPNGAPLEDPRTRQQLEEMTRTHPRLWLVMFGNPAEYDPTGYLERWLGAHAFKTFARGFVDASLSLYVMPSTQATIQQPLRVTLGENIQLVGYTLDRAQIAPGETLRLTLRWQAQSPIPNRYQVFTHVIGTMNPATQSPVWAQMDSEPVGGARPTTTWQTGEAIEDRYGLQIPQNTPPGEYLLEVGMYDATTLTRLPVFDEDGKRVADDRVLLSTVRVNAQ